jgi:hypothetical protein
LIALEKFVGAGRAIATIPRSIFSGFFLRATWGRRKFNLRVAVIQSVSMGASNVVLRMPRS